MIKMSKINATAAKKITRYSSSIDALCCLVLKQGWII
jgi:hypothetical protein